MKHKLIILALAATALLSGCDNNITVDGKNYPVYGIANMELNKDPNMIYEMSAASVIVAIIFCETVVVPVYVIGWDLWEPVRKRDK